jgi:PTS system nitrogen regulatory IIA component
VAVPLPASTRASVLKELVNLAEQSWQVYDPDAVLDAVRAREEMASTALPGGVAIPHPRRPLRNALGESVVAFGRTASGLPFGSPGGGLTDVFFLVCCRDERTHLRVLARLTRLLQRPDFLDELRSAETPAEAYRVIVRAEEQLTAA